MHFILSAFLTVALPCAATADIESRPNIVVILCDDLGWGDLQNYGHPNIKTPHLMQMAADGIRFTDFYSAAPVCSPARVGLLTGRMPNRAGVYDWIPQADPDKPLKSTRSLVEMRQEEFTIPAMLKAAGYATCMSGKWHCNAMFNSGKQAQPGDHGFDHWFATQNNASPSHENPVNFFRNGEPVGKIEGFSCRIVADEFVNWLADHHESSPNQPFFAYIAYHEPHEPVASPPDMVRKYERRSALNHDEAQYFANVENLDTATGEVLKVIDDLGYRENTLVIFTSDNGPETLNRYRSANRSYGRPGPLRGMKLHTHEAGFRVAGIMRWPKQIEAGQISETPVSALDFLPSFAEMSGATVPDNLILDGTSFLPALDGSELPRKKPLMWVYYNSYTGKGSVPSLAMRDGDMKIRAVLGGISNHSQIDELNAEEAANARPEQFELYDLSADPSESNPLPLEGSDLPARLETFYKKAFPTFHIWPALSE